MVAKERRGEIVDRLAWENLRHTYCTAPNTPFYASSRSCKINNDSQSNEYVEETEINAQKLRMGDWVMLSAYVVDEGSLVTGSPSEFIIVMNLIED